MEVENQLFDLFVVENGLLFGAILHFHVSSRECKLCGTDMKVESMAPLKDPEILHNRRCSVHVYPCG